MVFCKVLCVNMGLTNLEYYSSLVELSKVSNQYVFIMSFRVILDIFTINK